MRSKNASRPLGRVAVEARRQSKRHEPFAPNAQVGAPDIDEADDEQTGLRQQSGGERDLGVASAARKRDAARDPEIRPDFAVSP